MNLDAILKDLEVQALGLDFSKLNGLKPIPKKTLGYHGPEEIIDFISSNYNSPQEIDLSSLAVNGRVEADPMEEYLKTKAVSSSACKEVLKTPLHYFYYMHQPIPRKTGKHFELGTFAHMAFLEPKLFESVIVEPKCNLASNEGCEAMIKFYEDALDKALYNKDIDVETYKNFHATDRPLAKLADKKEYLEALRNLVPYMAIDADHKIIVDVLKRNYYTYGGGIIPRLLKGAIHEVSFYGQDPETGLSVKVRPDGFNTKENIGVDAVISMKTTKANDLTQFYKDSAYYEYELSEGMYQEVISNITGRDVKATIMIMLQTCPPYLPAVLYWHEDDLENGKYKYRSALTTIKECEEKGSFPGFDAMAESGLFGIVKMKQPGWAQRELLPTEIE